MKFETARTLVKVTLGGAVAFALVALVTSTNGSAATDYLMVGAIACIILCLFFVITGVKCPYCGKRIIQNCLRVKICPHCYRNLATGEKQKSRKIK